MPTVIEDGSYREEADLLKDDPHIIAMAGEVYNNMRSVADQIIEDKHVPNMMQRVLEEYRRRAGDKAQHHSIGGPLRGMRLALIKIHAESS